MDMDKSQAESSTTLEALAKATEGKLSTLAQKQRSTEGKLSALSRGQQDLNMGQQDLIKAQS